ncbi:MAG: HAD family hydrolase [Candidatus Micrarchaeota archaeon]|nr:HAD family hydrolase [Candidatus Micrarchaeota archaeon]
MGELDSIQRDGASGNAELLDADDTLFPNTNRYEEAKVKMKAIFEKVGFDPNYAVAKFEEIDHNGVKKFGFSSKRFPTSMVDTYKQLCGERDMIPNPVIEKQLFEIGSEVFEGPWELFPWVRETLDALKERGDKLIILTAGDRKVQKKKIMSLGLDELVDAYEIVGMKDANTFAEVISKYKLDRDSTTMIGNSLKSDILPARQAGIKAVLIHVDTWSFERLNEDQTKELARLGYKEVSSFAEILRVLPPNGHKKIEPAERVKN